jgi:alkylated DNA repair dioxygenase AlkB
MTLFDRRDLGFVLPGSDNIPDNLAEKRPCERRNVRYRSVSRICLVLTDDSEGLLASVVPNEGHGASELGGRDTGLGRDDLRAPTPGAPVTNITPGTGQGLAVTRRLRFAMAPPRIVQRRVDQFQPTRRDIVRMPGNRSIRQVLDKMVLVHKCSAHAGNMGIPAAFFTGNGPSGTVPGAERSPVAPSKKVLSMTQFGLFTDQSAGPAGLRYQPEFVPQATESELISRISELPLQPFQFGAFEGKRRVASFGFRYDYTLGKLQEAEPIPGWLTSIIASVERFGELPEASVRQILCTEYDVGVGIGWHRDKPHFDKVFGLSLGASCKFRFRRAIGDKWERFTLTAEPRSLYMMSGESRQVWEHSIPAVEQRRYSITFRTMKADAAKSRSRPSPADGQP